MTAVPDAENHQHGFARADRAIVEIDADHGIGSARPRFVLKLLQRLVARTAQHLFVAARAAADDVPYGCEKIAEDIRAHDGLAGDDAVIGDDALALDAVGGADDHAMLLLSHRI